MSTFIERLLTEETELNEKKSKLYTFIQSENFDKIGKNQKALLKIQVIAMDTYSECLNQRIIDLNNSDFDTIAEDEDNYEVENESDDGISEDDDTSFDSNSFDYKEDGDSISEDYQRRQQNLNSLDYKKTILKN